jgi:hypothetical protein
MTKEKIENNQKSNRKNKELMSKMDLSFADRDSSSDLGDIIADFANADEDNSAKIPVKKLAELFDTCAAKNEDGMKVFLRVRPCNKQESTIIVESDYTILTNAPDSSKRALYTKTESRHYVRKKFLHLTLPS